MHWIELQKRQKISSEGIETLLVFIDESGDPGFRLVEGSSPVFVFSMVIFHDHHHAELCGKAIDSARQACKIKGEFKFSQSHPNVRNQFFEAVAPFDFRVRSLVVVKDRINSPHLQANTNRFYNYFVRLLMTHDASVLQNARIKLDGSGNKRFKQELAAYIRKALGHGKIKDFKLVDSHKNNLIQLADMCVGAVARAYNPKVSKNADNWLVALRRSGKISDVWEFQ